MPNLQDRNYSFDVNLQVSDGAAAIAATGYAQNGGAQGIIDLGGNQGTSPKQQARIDCVMVVDFTAATLAAAAGATLWVVGSNDPGFASGNVPLAGGQVGATTGFSIPNPATINTGQPVVVPYMPGRLEIFFTTQWLGQLYQYVSLYVVIAGGASVTFKAFVAVLPEP